MVVGVSAKESNLAKNIVYNLLRFNYSGDIYPVGQGGGTINGLKIFPRIEDVPASPELAVFLIPAQFIPEAMDACGRKGVHYAVIESGGFSEFKDENQALEEEVIRVAKRWKIRFVGPNCVSIINLENGLVLPFVPVYQETTNLGHVSLISQSGGVLFECLNRLAHENMGFNKLISIGNKLDLKESDYLSFLISDPGTRIIGLYLESIPNGRRLMDLAATTEKPIIILKANTGKASKEIAQSHTAALTGDDKVADAALKQAGIHRVATIGELINCFKIFSLPLMRGRNLAIICRSGGQAVMAADASDRYGFRLVRFSKNFLAKVRQKARAGVVRLSNPLDLGDVFDLSFYIEVIEDALCEEGVDGVVFRHEYNRKTERDATMKLIQEAQMLSKTYDKPVAFCLLVGPDEWLSMKKVAEFPIFLEPEEAIRALSYSVRHSDEKLKASTERSGKSVYAVVEEKADKSDPGRYLGPRETFSLLQAYGFTVPDYALAGDVWDALMAAERIGYPVVLKTASPDIIHKTEVGGVRLNIDTPDELKDAFHEIKRNSELEGGVSDEKLLVQKMVPGGQEIILGGKRDLEFGPVVMFGLGGIMVEILKDVVIRVAPVPEAEAKRMLREIRGAALLTGFRNQKPADIDALVRYIITLSELLIDHPEIIALDMNPVIVFDEGSGGVVVDSKILISHT